jgi:hypothetical protein
MRDLGRILEYARVNAVAPRHVSAITPDDQP